MASMFLLDVFAGVYAHVSPQRVHLREGLAADVARVALGLHVTLDVAAESRSHWIIEFWSLIEMIVVFKMNLRQMVLDAYSKIELNSREPILLFRIPMNE